MVARAFEALCPTEAILKPRSGIREPDPVQWLRTGATVFRKPRTEPAGAVRSSGGI